MTQFCCHICHAQETQPHPLYQQLKRVTSDCKPWPSGAALFTCRNCHSVQVDCNEQWRGEIEKIYQSYTIYYQSGGEEQRVFDARTGRSLPRSEWLLERMRAQMEFVEAARALDIGCGNGRFLKAFGQAHPRWTLVGTEFDAQNKAIVERLPQVEKLHTGPLAELDGTYDFISLIHVLEHIIDPVPFLREVATKLNPGGTLFVELPSYESNPFELLIADHATHFTPASASEALHRAGLSVAHLTTDWVPKELSILARSTPPNVPAPASAPGSVDAALQWLHEVVRQTRELAAQTDAFGILGTSIASTWLASSLDHVPAFFVDEDPHRVGKTHLGRPIFPPADIAAGSTVFIAQPQTLAPKIAERLSRPGVSYVFPR